jgi:N-methylhydantoinase A
MLSSAQRQGTKKAGPATGIRVAIDTGGTFTDCVYSNGTELAMLKVPSTPANPAQAVLASVSQIAGQTGVEVRHGTTVGTNALLERKGARTCFIATAGFEDTIEIGRQARPKLYDWFFEKDPPLAPESMRIGVEERVASDGSVLKAVTDAEIARLQEQVRACRAESVAISFLFSFVNPRNERVVASALRELNLPLSISHEILPEFREYERGSTVLINAYLAPKMLSYIGEIDRTLNQQGSRLLVMQSSGGTVPAQIAAREPVRAILSGPAGGIIGAVSVARAAGYSKILTFDMGGTSTDVALIDGERGPAITNEYQIGGMPVAAPMLDIHTVGAGGGSLAWFDSAGALHVGPQSAGAHPGPICYGTGTEPTVTDANLLLGRIDAGMFLGGRMKLDRERTCAGFAKSKGSLKSAEEFAEGIVEVANLRMSQALRKISVERGLDPREFILVSFGGAGPLHACALAESLHISKVLIPAFPGALSAYGILISDIVRDYSRTVMLSPSDPSIERLFRELEMKGRREMKQSGLQAVCMRSLDLRYEGQGYELNLPAGGGLLHRFHRFHRERYGYSDPARAVQVVNLRVRMISASQPVHFPRQRLRPGAGEQAVLRGSTVVIRGKSHKARIYDRSLLHAGDRFEGPAVIAEYSATTFVPPRSLASVDARGNIVIDINREKNKL